MSQTDQELKQYAATFPAMPISAFALNQYLTPPLIATIAAGSPANDLEWTVFDSDYVDGETNGFDTFHPTDPSQEFPGADKIKLIECVSSIDTDVAYGGARGDRIILGEASTLHPFFCKGADGIDNDYLVIRHFDFNYGFIELRGSPNDYRLIYADQETDGVQTNGWYLFYTAAGSIDLIAFVYACNDVVSETPVTESPLCNADKVLSLENLFQFKYAKAVSSISTEPQGIEQVGGKGKEVVSGITVDAHGNTYLYGLTDSNYNNTPAVPNKLFVSKTAIDSTTSWITELPVSEASLIFDAATDHEFLYAAGRTYGSLPGFQNKGRWDAIILKIALSTGEIVAMHQFGTEVIDGFGNITLDDNGHLYVSGAGAPFGTTTPGDNSFLLAKYDRETLTQIWVETKPVISTATRVAEAWGGISYLAGDVPGNGKLLLGGWFANPPNGADGFLALYSNLNATQPTRLNTFIVSSPGFRADWVWGSTFAPNGTIYAVGYTTGNLGGTHMGEGDGFLLRLEQNLTNPVYKQVGTPKSERLRKVFVDTKGDVYVSGHTYGNLTRENYDPRLLSGDIIVQKYDAALNLLKSTQLGTASEERGFIALRSNRLYVGGMTEGSLVTESKGSFDGFALALDPASLEVITPELITHVRTEQIENQMINLYPNPTTETITLQNPKDSLWDYRITNVSGQVVMSGHVSQPEINVYVGDLHAGLYTITIQSAGQLGATQLKLVKH